MQGFACAPFGSHGGSRAHSAQSLPPNNLAPYFAQQQAAAQKGQDAARQQNNQHGSLHMHSAPMHGATANAAPTRTATGATSRAPPIPQMGNSNRVAAAHQAMCMQQQPAQQRQAPEQGGVEKKLAAAAEEAAAAAGKERRAQVGAAPSHSCIYIRKCVHSILHPICPRDL